MTAGTVSPRGPGALRHLGWLGSGITLGILLALLSALTALASYQGMRAGSDQRRAEDEARRVLDEANAAYLAANQEAVADYTYFDTWYLHRDDPELAGPYLAAFSPALRAAVERNVDDPFDDAYYEQVYRHPNDLYSQAETLFGAAQEHDSRSDRLQLVVMICAVGLALAAAGALLGSRNPLRLLLAALAILALIGGAIAHFTIPGS